MRASTVETINVFQLATTTDRLLAYGRFSKRRGPHVSHRPPPITAPAANLERTLIVRPRRPAADARTVAMLSCMFGVAFGSTAKHATAV